MNIFFQLFSLFSAAPPGRRHSIAVGQSTQSHHQHHTRRKSIQVVCLSVCLLVCLSVLSANYSCQISSQHQTMYVDKSVSLTVCLSLVLTACKLISSIYLSYYSWIHYPYLIVPLSLFINSYFSGEPGQPDPEYVCWNQKPQELKLRHQQQNV